MHSRTTALSAVTAPGAIGTDPTAGLDWHPITLPEGTNPTLAFNSSISAWLEVDGTSIPVTLHVIGSMPGTSDGVVFEVEVSFAQPEFRLAAVPSKTQLRIVNGTAEIGVEPEADLTTATLEVEGWTRGRTTGTSERPTPAVVMVAGAPLTVALISHEFIATSDRVGDSVGMNVWQVVVARSDHPAVAILPRLCELREDPAGRFYLMWALSA